MDDAELQARAYEIASRVAEDTRDNWDQAEDHGAERIVDLAKKYALAQDIS